MHPLVCVFSCYIADKLHVLTLGTVQWTDSDFGGVFVFCVRV